MGMPEPADRESIQEHCHSQERFAHGQEGDWREKVTFLVPFEPDDADCRVSAALVPSLRALYGVPDSDVRARLERFLQAHRSHLCFVAENHADDPLVAPLLHQPELPMILDLLEADPTGLLTAWPPSVPRPWLDALAEAWGRPL